MSAAIAFDTHRFVKNLTASGFTEAQAEALAHEQIHLLEANLATKSDIVSIKADLEVKIEQVKAEVQTVKADLEVKLEQVRAEIQTVKSDLEVKIEQVRADLEVKIEQVKSSLLIWMVGALTAHLAVVVAVIQILVRTA